VVNGDTSYSDPAADDNRGDAVTEVFDMVVAVVVVVVVVVVAVV
jgi:hypothetical protein